MTHNRVSFMPGQKPPCHLHAEYQTAVSLLTPKTIHDIVLNFKNQSTKPYDNPSLGQLATVISGWWNHGELSVKNSLTHSLNF